MENNYVLCSGDEFYHWGIKGMKWGVRRYQNKDGSLTPAGQKRRDKLQAKLDKIDNKDAPKNSGKVSKKISDMTDDELREYITRKNSEKMAYTLERDIAQLNPKKVSAGQKFAESMKNEIMRNTADAAGKAVKEMTNKAMEKALGKGAADPLSALKKEAEKAGYQQTISNAKKAAAEAIRAEKEARKKDDVDPELSAREREAKLADYDKRVSEARNAKAKADWQETVTKTAQDKYADDRAARESNRSSNSNSEASSNRTSNTSSNTSSNSTSNTSSSRTSTETGLSIYNGFQSSHGNDSWSSFKRNTSSQQKNGKDFIDADWHEVKDDD